MSEKYKMDDPEGIYFSTMTIIQWVDLFTRNEIKHVIVDSLKFCQKEKGLVIYSWCLMPSHLHMIVSSNEKPLSFILRDFKKFTSKAIIEEFNHYYESRREWLLNMFENAGKDLNRIKHFKVWKDGNRPKQLISNEFMGQKLDYIHMNPVVDEVVDQAEHYLFSSARNYAGEKGLIGVRLLI